MEPRVSLVTLGVSDLARSVAFYEALGWRRARASVEGEAAFFQAGPIALALWSRAALAADSGTAGADRGGWGGVTLAHNVDSPAQVEALLAEARAAGAHVVRPGAPTGWGGYAGCFHDPDGHPWEVAHNPAWTLGEDGTVRIRPA
ncbi:MAG TPA: VOC family protein [Miltoncostaeaceae bacterium]|nr:VOC family protein [Miltoncostaeaceae bacterium]